VRGAATTVFPLLARLSSEELTFTVLAVGVVSGAVKGGWVVFAFPGVTVITTPLRTCLLLAFPINAVNVPAFRYV